jgi:flavin reductase (DIM6/NTAB) family NADH-FMN oxidoreductase RutF
MTASAVASLSLEPVLLLVCISNRLPTHEAIEQSRAFVVNVLGEGQGELARRFATPLPDKFEGIELREGCQLPVLADSIAHFVCDVHERFPGGDHSIFTGLVRECGCIPGRRPLLYFRSRFGAFDDPDAELARAGVGWDVASLGSIGTPSVTLEGR